MASSKHINEPTGLKLYEENEIRLKGIVGFAIGLFLLIVITFGLMWVMLLKLEQFNAESAGPKNPLAMSEKEKLPPEPRVQLAPGFGIDTEKGRVNLELMAPAAEYRELHSEWLDVWEHGKKDPQTGTVTILPIDEAKEKFLEENAKAKSGPEAEEYWKNSRSYVSDASSGRVAGETRR